MPKQQTYNENYNVTIQVYKVEHPFLKFMLFKTM